MPQVGTAAQPVRVAVIGSGPSGFYAVEHLLKHHELAIEVDMFDRLPTPFGLVRGGVAPDHAKIKSVIKVYERIATNPNFRFYGNVEFGRDVSHEELKAHYHAIIYAVGAQTDRRLGVPGEDLAGSHAATEFVGWYNAHPDYRDLKFDLSQERVAVIGNGNVAMDVARILASSYEELVRTDIADYALEALRESKVREIYVLGRRGPAQAAFTNPEIKELGELELAEAIVRDEDIALDALTQAALEREPDTLVEKNLKVMRAYAAQGPTDKPRKIHMRFLVSPVELTGTNHVESIKLVKNVLQASSDGSLRPRATEQTEEIPVGLVFRSIGYMGVALPGVPFDERGGVIPNVKGRVIDPANGQPVGGEYVVGWIKRGPSGIIGTNKPDAQETADLLLEDVVAMPEIQSNRAQVEAWLTERKPDFVSFDDWLVLDQMEIERGQAQGRPRLKFSRITDMLSALSDARQANAATELSPSLD